eukprot:CAMPEP_0183315846 /NCGR_PEP_ID=MMETSP0160_2-20130417/53028_1 /TAXON_ID=2839 ORGANISM="Odontella Sinensis, Strain Grunow 1884" /NCGR_SAMPLE_ID=MMETSP0160_2 /ASSEMBLY_ACC=CAM_ASM_000250 /LENGTH=348 /DNA_ID=CAMNT_0025481513 /DNA_START=214 /DNA_END=1257 /DNA_ORIENTATION=+
MQAAAADPRSRKAWEEISLRPASQILGFARTGAGGDSRRDETRIVGAAPDEDPERAEPDCGGNRHTGDGAEAELEKGWAFEMTAQKEPSGTDSESQNTELIEDFDDNPSGGGGFLQRLFLLLRCLFFVCAYVLIGFCASILIGAEVEMRSVERVPSTAYLYNTSEVCVMEQSVKNQDYFETREYFSLGHEEENIIAHCGGCGLCSTINDMSIMAQTWATLTKDATYCGTKALWGGEGAVTSCMDKRVGFTPSCTDCWVDNVMCTKRHCTFTCLKSIYLLRERNNPVSSNKLNSCLECDERMCGPAFLECSGANRRQLGIVSDIGRNAQSEQCEKVDVDWSSGIFQNDP